MSQLVLFIPLSVNNLMLTFGSGNHLKIRREQITNSVHPEREELRHSFKCRTCPYEFIVDNEYYNRRMSRVKQVDDIMGGSAAWQNVDQTTGTFPSPLVVVSTLSLTISYVSKLIVVPMCVSKQCGATKAYYRQMQIRSADEPMTTFYKCVECGSQWREN